MAERLTAEETLKKHFGIYGGHKHVTDTKTHDYVHWTDALAAMEAYASQKQTVKPEEWEKGFDKWWYEVDNDIVTRKSVVDWIKTNILNQQQ